MTGQVTKPSPPACTTWCTRHETGSAWEDVTSTESFKECRAEVSLAMWPSGTVTMSLGRWADFDSKTGELQVDQPGSGSGPTT